MYYKKLEDSDVQCFLCPHNCKIADKQRGVCTVRENREGVLHSLNYNRISSMGMDPIEKKPLYHFYPGSQILSVGSIGCNLKCSFCQNYSIAQYDAPTEEITSTKLVDIAQKQENNIGIAFTYNEPSIWYEYVYETSTVAKYYGLKTVLVTNGFIEEEPFLDIIPFIDAMNIDVKGFTEKYYKETCKGILEPVKKIVEIASVKCHIEITTLVVTDLNDSLEEIGQLSHWLAGLNKDIPLHLSRYFPNYKMSNDPTPISVLEEAKREALKHLNYVYIGNVQGQDNTTYCPNCRKPVITRGRKVEMTGIEDERCTNCGHKVHVVYQHP